MKLRLASIVTVVFLCMGITACKKQAPVVPQITFGDMWRSWSLERRQGYIWGFLEGHGITAGDLCETLDQKEALNLKSEEPVRDCINTAGLYTHSLPNGISEFYTRGSDEYIASIDTFYAHPECRALPTGTLMEHLRDDEFKSDDELFAYVHSGKASWGFFSITGIEGCFP